MVATFPRAARSHQPPLATYRWADGSVATTPSWGGQEHLPHDLGHYLSEAWFRPPYGFWALLAEQLPFSSMTIVRGRWPKGAHERLRALVRQHGTDMLKAEATDVSWVADPGVDIAAEWPAIRATLERSYVFGPHNPYADVTPDDLRRFANRGRALRNLWRRVPVGGALEVHWPPDRPPVVVAPAALQAAG